MTDDGRKAADDLAAYHRWLREPRFGAASTQQLAFLAGCQHARSLSAGEVADEREACAKLVDGLIETELYYQPTDTTRLKVYREVAAAIRARGTP